MDTSNLIFSMLFGTFGMGFLMYGKSAARMVPLVAGLLLMVVPYFIPNVIALVIVCIVLTIVPFVLRDL